MRCLLFLTISACSSATSVDLPKVATIGATAADLGLDHVVVTVAADGRIFTADGETTPEALVRWLIPHADRSRDESLPQLPSNVHLVIRADGAVRWGKLSSILMTAVDPRNRMHRVLFVVRSTDPTDAGEGTFACFLPLDRGRGGVGVDLARTVGVPEGTTLGELLTALEGLLAAGIQPSPCLVTQNLDGIRVWNFERHEWCVAPSAGVPVRRETDLVGITRFPVTVEPIFLDPDLYENGDVEFPREETIGD